MPALVRSAMTFATVASLAWLLSCALTKAVNVVKVRGRASFRVRRASVTFCTRSVDDGLAAGLDAAKPASVGRRWQVIFWAARCVMSGPKPLSLEMMGNVA